MSERFEVPAKDEKAKPAKKRRLHLPSIKRERNPSHNRKVPKRAVALASVVVLFGLPPYLLVSEHNSKKNAAQNDENKFVEKNRLGELGTAMCVNRNFILAEGTVITKQPKKVNSTLPIILGDNVIDKVEKGEGYIGTQFIVSSKGGDTHLGFRIGRPATENNFMTSDEIAKEIEWVDYGQNQENIRTFTIGGTPVDAPISKTDLASCRIDGKNGRITTMEDRDAAFAVAASPETALTIIEMFKK